MNPMKCFIHKITDLWHLSTIFRRKHSNEHWSFDIRYATFFFFFFHVFDNWIGNNKTSRTKNSIRISPSLNMKYGYIYFMNIHKKVKIVNVQILDMQDFSSPVSVLHEDEIKMRGNKQKWKHNRIFRRESPTAFFVGLLFPNAESDEIVNKLISNHPTTE